MKNKPYPALLRPSNLSNEIGKRVPKSRETIPLIFSKKRKFNIKICIYQDEKWSTIITYTSYCISKFKKNSV
jgi:hypothetical protein